MEDGNLMRAPGRKRDEATRQTILRTAYEAIAAEGYRALTIEGVAARSGSGKSTIYRWWPSKAALAADAFQAMVSMGCPGGDDGSTAEAIRALLRGMAETLSGTPGRVLASILGGALEDREAAALYKERIGGQRKEILRAYLRRGVETGELRADLDVDATMEALMGPFLARLLLEPGSWDVAWADRISEVVLRGALASAGRDTTR